MLISHERNQKKKGGAGAMVEKKDWAEFRETGLLWWINMILHTFGWAICFEIDENGTINSVYPSRVKFRGFEAEFNDEGYRKVSIYLKENADILNSEAHELS